MGHEVLPHHEAFSGLGTFALMLLVSSILSIRLRGILKPSSLPRTVSLWLFVDGIIRTYDGLFGVLRPASMSWKIYEPYKTYCGADRTYCDLGNGWMWTESYMDLWEVSLGTIALWMASTPPVSFPKRAPQLLALVATTMCFHKTCMYLLMEPMTDYAATGHNDWVGFWLIWFLPNFIWVVMPGVCMCILSRDLLAVAEQQPTAEAPPVERDVDRKTRRGKRA